MTEFLRKKSLLSIFQYLRWLVKSYLVGIRKANSLFNYFFAILITFSIFSPIIQMLNGEICLDKSNKQLIFLKGLFTFKVPFTNGIEIPLINITFFLPALFIGIVAYRYYFYKAMGLAYPKAVECFCTPYLYQSCSDKENF